LHGISIGSTGGAVTIGPGNTLTLGSNGIDMGAATQNLTISSGLALATGHQIWDIATGRTLTTTGTLTRGAGSTLLIDTSLRSGTVAGTSFNNASGIVGPWAFVKSSGAPANNLGNGHTFATKDLGGNLVPYTAATPQTSTGAWGGIASGGDGTLNCDISSSAAVLGTTGLNRNLNTLRYTGSGARQPGNNAGDLLTLNGLMNAGTGPFTIGRNGANITNDFSFGILIGASNELVLAPLSADIVLYGFIKDGAGGAGTVTIAGNNTVTFGGSNTFTGGLHLNSGTLQLGNDTALGSGTLRVNGGGIRATGAPRTVGNNMVLDGAFTLGRGTNFSGPVALLRDISITSANPDLQAAATSAISGVISGAYRITFNEAANPIGTIVLSGANTHGGTTLNGGILQVGNAGALGASTGDLVVNGGTLDLNAFNPTVRSLSGAGGVISNLASGASLLTTRSALDSVFAGSLQDGAAGKPLALTKQGTGTLNLTGTNTYSGLTTVLAGTVLVNGSLGTASTVTIASGATLGGTGAVGGSATINGTHRPGTGAGTQAFGGTLNYGSSSTLKWDLVSNGTSFAAFDRVVASGAVSVANGAKLDVSFAAPGSGVAFNDAFWTRARSWTLLTGSSVVGNFTLNTFTNDPSGRALADYGTLALQQNGTSVTLLFTPLHTPFELWRQTYFGADWDNPAVAGDPVDGDRDGLVNLMEYALGTDPRIADPGVLQGSTDGGKLGISFTRNTAAADLTISVKAADDLSSTWTEIARSENGAAFTATAPGASVNESGGGAIKSVQATDIHLTNDPDHPKRFMRVTAQSNP
jgi:autotransporter-associated beta strand protein